MRQFLLVACCLVVAAAALLPQQAAAQSGDCQLDCILRSTQCQNRCGDNPDCQQACAIQKELCLNKCVSMGRIDQLNLKKKAAVGVADVTRRKIVASPFAFPIGETCADNCLISSVQCQNICQDDHECQVGCATVYDRCISNCAPAPPAVPLRDTCENDCVIKAVQCQNNCADDHDCQLECAAQKQMCFNKCESFTKKITDLGLQKKKLAGASDAKLKKITTVKSPFASHAGDPCQENCLIKSVQCQNICQDDHACQVGCATMYARCLVNCSPAVAAPAPTTVVVGDSCELDCTIRSVQCQNICEDDHACQVGCATQKEMCLSKCSGIKIIDRLNLQKKKLALNL